MIGYPLTRQYCLNLKFIDMKTFEEARATLDSNGLMYKELTFGVNGYPSFGGKSRFAYYGFGDDEFELCKQLALEVGGRVEQIYWRDGWQLAEDQGMAIERIQVSADMYSDDHAEWYEPVEEMDNLKDYIVNAESIEDIVLMVEDYKECSDACELASEDEFVLTACGKYVETVPRQAMNWSYDTANYAIAVVIDSEDFNVEEE